MKISIDGKDFWYKDGRIISERSVEEAPKVIERAPMKEQLLRF